MKSFFALMPEQIPIAARDAVLGFDLQRLEQWLDREADSQQPWHAWGEAWRQLFRGRWQKAHAAAEALEARASQDGHSVLVLEAATQRAVALMGMNDLDRCRVVARRASRMARTEAIAEQEYFAHLVLARVRRLSGHPHLAARILTALSRTAPPSWHGWLRWELVMAGGLEAAFPEELEVPGEHESNSIRCSKALAAWVASSETGDLENAQDWARYLQSVARWPLLQAEVEALLVGSGFAPGPPPPSVKPWQLGETVSSPTYLHGLFTRNGSAPEEETAIAYVHAVPRQTARRISRLAWAFHTGPDVRVLPQGRRKQGRNETLIAALALAGEAGMSEAQCFAQVYGFDFEREQHRNIFQVLVHRAREYLGDAGAIDHDHERLTLSLRKEVLVPDPRCTKSMQDRLLRAVAEHQGATAKEIASRIGVSLRVAQTALQELTADGACLTRREGRNVQYMVEDTTFSEPTRV